MPVQRSASWLALGNYGASPAIPSPIHLETQPVGGVIRARYFEERVHVSDRRDEVRHEASQGRVEVHLMGLVAPDVLEQVFNLRRYVEVRIVCGIVRPAVRSIPLQITSDFSSTVRVFVRPSKRILTPLCLEIAKVHDCNDCTVDECVEKTRCAFNFTTASNI